MCKNASVPKLHISKAHFVEGLWEPLTPTQRRGFYNRAAAGSLALICAVSQFICGILGGALLDRQLEDRIDALNRQRELIRRIRTSRAVPDYPARALRALEAILLSEQQAHGYGFLLSALTGDDRIATGVAAHLYSDEGFAEIELVFRAIPERGLTQEYLHVSHLMDALPNDASRQEREGAVDAGLDFLAKIGDCFDTRN